MSQSRRSKPIRRFFLHNVLPPFGWRLYRALGRSWDYEERNIDPLHKLIAQRQPVVGAFLHSRTFSLLHYFSLAQQGRWILMCSQSRDGEAMTRIEEGLGFRVARGSSGKGGARALVEMIKAQREDRGLNSCLAIDGSRGPRGIAQLGTITLAQKPVACCCRWPRRRIIAGAGSGHGIVQSSQNPAPRYSSRRPIRSRCPANSMSFNSKHCDDGSKKPCSGCTPISTRKPATVTLSHYDSSLPKISCYPPEHSRFTFIPKVTRLMRRILPIIMTTALLSAAVAAPATNPLLQPWQGPYGGVPPFDVATPALLAPALEAGMAEHLAELESIASNPAAPTFANTIAAMERSGRALDRASTVYYIYSSSLSDDAVQEVERNIEPKMAAFRDRITQNEKLFARIAKVYETRESSGLTAEEQRLTWLVYTNFVRAGAKLDAASKQRLGEINQSLAGLFTRFSQNLLGDESQQYLVLEKADELAGLPDSLRAGFAGDAERRGKAGQWVVANTRSSVEPFLTYSTRRDLREKVWRTFVNRGDNGDARDNNAIISEILQLRAERARLLGFSTHAHWRLENSMARTPERAMELMEAVWKPAVARVKEEVADMQALADSEGAKIRIEPWDYRFYAEKVRKAKYDLDTNELKPYLQLEKLREGMFGVAEELFGMRLTELATGTVPVYHPDVRVWRVEHTDGRLIGLFTLIRSRVSASNRARG